MKLFSFTNIVQKTMLGVNYNYEMSVQLNVLHLPLF